MKNTLRQAILTAVFAFAIFSSILLASCSSANPQIKGKSVKVIRVEGPDGSFAERLSVFILYEDSDGPADFGSIAVTHDETGLSWTIGPDRAEVRLRGKDRWVGSNILAGPAGGEIPKGEYTIVANDLAGNESIAEFALGKQSFPERAPCAFSITDGIWTITRNASPEGFTRIWILLYDSEGKLLNSWIVPTSGQRITTGLVKALTSVAPNAVTAQCYVENGSGSAGVLLTLVNMR
jgi:hypothetical protein